MGDRSAARLAIDVGFVAALVTCGVLTYTTSRAPAVPSEVCSTRDGTPHYDALYDDGRITVAAVFGELEGGPADLQTWTVRGFRAVLRGRGFVETSPDRFELGAMTIDVTLLPDDRARLESSLNRALADHDLVYFNGHNQAGSLALAPSDAYRIIVMDSCYSTQLYSAKLIGPTRDVIGNRERAVTGSVESLLGLLDGLREQKAWAPLLDEMNELAERRARSRGATSRYKHAEEYRLDRACQPKSVRRRD